jgi:hypothetical protein
MQPPRNWLYLQKQKSPDSKEQQGFPFNSLGWLRGVDLNHRPLGYEPNELPDCSTPPADTNRGFRLRSRRAASHRSIRHIDFGPLAC